MFSFEQTLAAELETVHRLRALLEEEQNLLIRGDANAGILPITEKKNALCDQLVRLSEQRDRHLRMLALPPGQDGMTTWLKTHPDQKPTWSSLLEVTDKARAMNQANGNVVRDRLNRAAQAVATLQGSTRTSTYGPDGQLRQSAFSRKLYSS